MTSVVKKISDYNIGIQPALRELKWKALKESPFRFYRGTAHLFAEDFVRLYKYKPKVLAWICGDLHFENFGSYKGENRLVYFDLCDFDEAILAGPEPELARFLTSLIVAGGQMNMPDAFINEMLWKVTGAYAETLQKGKALMLEAGVARGAFNEYFDRLNKFDRQSFIAKKTEKRSGALVLKNDNIHFMQLDDSTKRAVYNGIEPLFNTGKFKGLVFEDAASRIAGTGSLGVERYCVLCYSQKKGKRYLIDVKRARPSCFAPYINVAQPVFANEAERVDTIGYIMQFNPPAFVSAANINKKWFIVKELQLMENKMSVTDFSNDIEELGNVAVEMAILMGYAHIRSSGHIGSSTADELKKFAGDKSWQQNIIDTCGILAQLNSKYFHEFVSGA